MCLVFSRDLLNHTACGHILALPVAIIEGSDRYTLAASAVNDVVIACIDRDVGDGLAVRLEEDEVSDAQVALGNRLAHAGLTCGRARKPDAVLQECILYEGGAVERICNACWCSELIRNA